VGIKIREQLSIRQIKAPREKVCHCIHQALDVRHLMVVPVVAPMQAREPTQVGSRLIRSDRPFPIPRHSGHIVIYRCKRQLPKVKEGGRDVSLAQHSRLFKITVGDVTGAIRGRDNARLDIRREGGLPQSGGVPRGKHNATHPCLGCIHRANHRGIIGHNFRNPSGALQYAPGKRLKVRQVVPQVRRDPNSMSIRVGEAQLESTKQARRSWYCRCHEPELT
jgi:hypothetical protein